MRQYSNIDKNFEIAQRVWSGLERRPNKMAAIDYDMRLTAEWFDHGITEDSTKE